MDFVYSLSRYQIGNDFFRMHIFKLDIPLKQRQRRNLDLTWSAYLRLFYGRSRIFHRDTISADFQHF